MAIRRQLWQNTGPGHNKDYLIEWDLETNIITSTYGIIDGHKTVRRDQFRDSKGALDELNRKIDRRTRHGYTCILNEQVGESAPAAVPAARPHPRVAFGYSPHEFDADLWKMRNAEKLQA